MLSVLISRSSSGRMVKKLGFNHIDLTSGCGSESPIINMWDTAIPCHDITLAIERDLRYKTSVFDQHPE